MNDASPLEDRWTHEDIIKSFDTDRMFFRPASADLVRSIFSKYIAPSDKILEVGSGLGELTKLIPEYQSRITQIEQSPRVSQVNKRTNPETNLASANVYNLPFPDGSFNVVTGYSVFDTLADLPKALTETRRVLTAKGKFIHFLDMAASVNTLFWTYKNSNYIPFPAHGKEGEAAARLIPRSKLKNLLLSVSEEKRGFYEGYATDPESYYVLSIKNNSMDLLDLLAHDVENFAPDVSSITFNEFFYNNIQAALKQTGFTTIEAEREMGTSFMKPQGIYLKYPNRQLYYNNVGNIEYFNQSSKGHHPLNQIQIVSILHTVVAQKK